MDYSSFVSYITELAYNQYGTEPTSSQIAELMRAHQNQCDVYCDVEDFIQSVRNEMAFYEEDDGVFIDESRKPVKSSVRWDDDNYIVETFEEYGNGEFYVTDKSNPRNVKTFYSEKDAIQWAKNKSINSSRQIKSGWERTDMASGPIWDKDNWRIIERREHSGDEDDKYYLLRDKSNSSKEDLSFDTLAEAMDHVDINIELSHRLVKSGYKISPLEWANRWIPEIYDQRKFMQLCEQKGISKIDSEEFFKLMDEFGFKSNGKTFEYDASKYLYNSRQIKSARYIATDPESGEVLGSADTYEEAVNEWGEDVTITDSEVEGGSYVRNSRRPIKSGYDILNVGNKTPAGNLVFYLVNDGKRMPIMTEDYAIREGGYDKDYLYEGSKNGEFVRFDSFNSIINRLAEGCGLGKEEIEQIEYYITGNKVTFTVYPTERGIHLLNNGWWDSYSVRWELSAEEQIPLYGADEEVAMSVELTILGLSNDLTNSRKPVKSSVRWDDEDTIDVEVLAEELIKEGYEPDIVEQIKDKWLNEYSISELTDDEDRDFRRDVERLALNSSRESNHQFSQRIVNSVLTKEITEDDAIKQIASRNNMNIGFAKRIFNNLMEDKSLIQSGIMEMADDMNKEFNLNGDLYSWFDDYVNLDGKATTVGGELVRAANRILARFENDGDKIGIGYGKETVNPAARYILAICNDYIDRNDIEEMLYNESRINYSDEEYEAWLQQFQRTFEDYLRDHEELFHSPNKNDMWDYKEDDDTYSSVSECCIYDDNGNEYWFQRNEDDEWKCTNIEFGTQPEYEVDETFSSASDFEEMIYSKGEQKEPYGFFSENGLTYNWEGITEDDEGNYREWVITDVSVDGGLADVGDVWCTDDFNDYGVFDINGREIDINELL